MRTLMRTVLLCTLSLWNVSPARAQSLQVTVDFTQKPYCGGAVATTCINGLAITTSGTAPLGQDGQFLRGGIWEWSTRTFLSGDALNWTTTGIFRFVFTPRYWSLRLRAVAILRDAQGQIVDPVTGIVKPQNVLVLLENTERKPRAPTLQIR
jgi:hypothetical protein